MWLGLNASLQHALPATLELDDRSTAQGSVQQLLQVGVRAVPVAQLQAWGRSYDSILLALELDGRFYVEGDGSFVVCGHCPVGDENQQVLWLGEDASLVSVASTPGWRAATESDRPTVVWRIEGNLFAGIEELDYATVNGFAPWSEWARLLQLLAPQPVTATSTQDTSPRSSELLVQLHRFGQYIRLAEPPHGVS